MDRKRAVAWLESYRRAWEEADTQPSSPCSPPTPPTAWGQLDAGTDPGWVVADQARRWADGYERAWRAADPEAGAAVEWWTTLLEEDQPAILIGCSILAITRDGLVATGRDYWFLEPGAHPPFDGWGR
jgi:hypothetical protein